MGTAKTRPTSSEDASVVARLIESIHAHLDSDLDLATLSQQCGWSPYQLHRRFQRTTGETLAKFVERVRMGEAGYSVVAYDESMLELALRCGYESHETFTRAFRRHYGVAPTQFRSLGRLRKEPQARLGADLEDRAIAGHFDLSRTRQQWLRPTWVLTGRHLGPYEDVPIHAWSAARKRALELGLPLGLEAGPYVGIAQDNPSAVPPQDLRFDAGVVLAGVTAQPSDNVVERVQSELLAPWFVQQLPAGPWAATRHVGAYRTLPEAYHQIGLQVGVLEHFEPLGAPSLEIFRADQMRSDRRVEFTDVLLLGQSRC